jgi:putative membrane protein insertion efficiency factor
MFKIISIYIIEFYQKIKFTYPSCRFYPTCSDYALQQFTNNSFIKALFFTIVRILRCNKLSKGGFDYPITKKNFKNKIVSGKMIKIEFWFIPTDNNKFYIIKAI